MIGRSEGAREEITLVTFSHRTRHVSDVCRHYGHCRLLRQQRAAQQNDFRHEMVLMLAVEKPTEVSSLPRPTAAGTHHTSIQSVRGEGRKKRINLIQM